VREAVSDEERAKLREQIGKNIEEALSLLEQYDVRDLLSKIAFENSFDNADNFEEGLFSNQISRVEYAQSLALAREFGPTSNAASSEIAEQFTGSIGRVFAQVGRYYSEERAEAARDDLAADIRFASILEHIGTRGSSYETHLFDLLRGLFVPHEPFLQTHYGIGIETVISSVEGIVQQINRNVSRYQTFLRDRNSEIKEMYDRHFRENAPHISHIQAFHKEWERRPEVLSKVEGFNRRDRELRHEVFAVDSSERVSERFLELFSASPGTNEGFLSFARAPGWPGNLTVVERKPFVSHEERYYCYSVQLFSHYAVDILETLIRESDARYFLKTYVRQRAAYLEKSALHYLARLLPGAKIFGKLFYEAEEDGMRKRLETDGLVLYDNNILIVEAKAGSFSAPARRGGLARIERDAGKLVDEAYGQATRTKKYIAEEATPRFEYEDGSTALVLENKDGFTNFYLVNVTLADLGHLSARLSSLRAFDFIEGDGWPWSVFINNLRVVSEIIDSPSEFLLYLQGRIRANEHGKFRSFSELDFLTFFLREGLEFEHDYYEQFDAIFADGYTNALDRYYEKVVGRLPEGEKPRIDIPPEFRRLVSGLEESTRTGFSDVTTTLLRLGRKTQEDILEQLEGVERLAADDGNDHDLTLVFRELDVGLTFAIRGRASAETLDSIQFRLRTAPRRNRVKTWILIAIDGRGSEEEAYDFRVFGDSEGGHHKKVGRNKPCPCGSGLKFKRCCGSQAG
jgi:SEC-C motif